MDYVTLPADNYAWLCSSLGFFVGLTVALVVNALWRTYETDNDKS